MKSNDVRTNWFDDGVLDDDRVRRVFVAVGVICTCESTTVVRAIGKRFAVV